MFLLNNVFDKLLNEFLFYIQNIIQCLHRPVVVFICFLYLKNQLLYIPI